MPSNHIDGIDVGIEKPHLLWLSLECNFRITFTQRHI